MTIARTCIIVACLLAGSGIRAAILGIDGTSFTLDGRPTFLIGASYYGGLGAPDETVARDLDDLRGRGFNWIRVWATWASGGVDVSAVDAEGGAREPFLGRLRHLVEAADRRGIVIDVTLARQNGEPAAPGSLPSQRAHLRAVETIARALKPWRNVYFDVANERNIRDRRHVTLDEVKALRDAIRAIDPERLVTASHAGGDIGRKDVEGYVRAGVDFLAPHRPRDAGSPEKTRAMTREVLAWARGSGRAMPVHYQEPFRRDYGNWQPSAMD
ncbi:MAG: cellulase family glycosylhydrolase, partial [Planctomycetes bacterium]|nr:cellulase family glycosylhydrolase [Planctomycetota bacterium]